MRRVLSVLVTFALLPSLFFAQNISAVSPTKLPGLIQAGQVIRDTNGIAHITASNDHDLMFLQGYVHAQDRLFQMDYLRRAASGTTAELFGTTSLALDVQSRTFGMRRGAERSLPMLSQRMQRMLKAYSDGVNAYATTHDLPPEYAPLGVSSFAPWTPIDSLAIARLLAYNLSFDLTDLDNTTALLTYQYVGSLAGFDGTALFFNDLFRSAPFEKTSTIPDATATPLAATPLARGKGTDIQIPAISKHTVDSIKKYLLEIDKLPLLRGALRHGGGGSNTWVISGTKTESGFPLLANDPHLDLGYPAIFYPNHLTAGTIDVTGNSVPGAPLVLLGHNRFVSWGFTTEYGDVVDFYQEQIVPDANSPIGLGTMYLGKPEPIVPIPEVFRARIGGQLVTVPPGNGIPPFSLIVPRRNNGPIIVPDFEHGSAISLQWTGFSGSREFDAMLAWAEAKNIADFQVGVQLFDCPPQNISYSDVAGNIAYFAAGELPVREDLQAGAIHALPPSFLRDGTGGAEWMKVTHPQPLQTLPYEIIPASEMPHIINPPAGFVMNANNDIAGLTLDNSPFTKLRPGGGIFYVTYEFNPGYRAARIQDLITQKLAVGKLSFKDMQEIQADTALRDAQFFVPYITQAFENAKRAGASPELAALSTVAGITEAAGRLRAWDFSTPTGIPEGYDAFDTPGQLNARSQTEIANSVAATIYSVWRGRFIVGALDTELDGMNLPKPGDFQAMTALRNLLENFDTSHGVGASGVPFFQFPGVSSAEDRRDIYILQALASSLNLLSGPTFANAFHGSTNQGDYRWGKLHRLLLDHPMGAPFSVPPAGGFFPAPLPGLSGIPTDGGYQTVDVSDISDSTRASNDEAFTWIHGPSHRLITEARKDGIHGVDSLPGGISGVIGDPLYLNLLPQWLVNDNYDMLYGKNELRGQISSVTKFVPAN